MTSPAWRSWKRWTAGRTDWSPSELRTSQGPGSSRAPTPHLPGFGIADASNVVLAERYGAVDILTTDQRDFRQIKLSGGRFFRVLPYDL